MPSPLPRLHFKESPQLDPQEEDEVLEQFGVLKKKEIGIAFGKKAKVEQAPDQLRNVCSYMSP